MILKSVQSYLSSSTNWFDSNYTGESLHKFFTLRDTDHTESHDKQIGMQ